MPTILIMRNVGILSILAAMIPRFLTASVPLEKPPNPTVVLVPGAWHSPQHFFELQDLLERAGYNTASQRSPSCGSMNPNSESVAKDAAFIRNEVLMPLLDARKTVVLAMHSYGGSPGATAAKGLSETERVIAGKPGGIIGLVFICAILPHDGQSLLSLLPGQKFDSWVIQKVPMLRPASGRSESSADSCIVLGQWPIGRAESRTSFLWSRSGGTRGESHQLASTAIQSLSIDTQWAPSLDGLGL